MKVLIDLQVAQTGTNPEAGKYALALSKAAAQEVGENGELLVLLNGSLEATIDELRAELEGFIKQENIRVWYAPDGMGSICDGNPSLRKVAAHTREAVIAEQEPDLVILPSLWLGWADEAVISFDYEPPGCPIATILPGESFHGPQKELEQGRRGEWHRSLLEKLSRADFVLDVPGLSEPELCNGIPDTNRVRWPSAEADQLVEALQVSVRSLLGEARSEKNGFAEKVMRSLNLDGVKPKLAFVSPLPPEKTGIGYYSAELLPELAHYYDIDVVVDQEQVSDEWIESNCTIRSVEWFWKHGLEYDRVVYQFGNSRFHAHMWDLIEKIPGVAVIHDFYLGDAVAYREDGAGKGLALPRELYLSHGYDALKPIITDGDRAEAIRLYPCSYSPIREAKGVIVHSNHARDLAREWYGDTVADTFEVIPHLRVLPERHPEEKQAARQRLGIAEDAFLICSFGVVNKSKLNHRLYSAWCDSRVANDPNARIVFVGETPDAYGQRLRSEIEGSSYSNRISFTGWADSETFQDYLAAADVAVQLRTNSRGETSGTVLDCMANGLATICNAHGSFAEVPDSGVWKLEDRFEEEDLITALDTLWSDHTRREQLGVDGREQIVKSYSPEFCSNRYFEAIEQAYSQHRRSRLNVIKTASEVLDSAMQHEVLAACIGNSLPVSTPQRQLLVDVTVVAREDLRTGVQRVVRSILSQLLDMDLPGYRIEPVYTNPSMDGFFYARQFTQEFMGGEHSVLPDEPMEAHTGDIFLGLDLHGDGIAAQCGYLEGLRDRGVKVVFVVHDLLPVTHPHWFPGPEEQTFENWLSCITKFDGAICVSQTTADELEKWMVSRNVERKRPYRIGVAHNGADIRQSVPSMGLPEDAEQVLAQIEAKPSFLMVGTVEPRKGVTQVLDAFEHLWQQGKDYSLVLVGKRGWNIEDLADRLENHPEKGSRLFWLQGISDEYLERTYAASTCLIAGSEGEGFGLPLIEAAQQEIPILARDIPVFREVAGAHAEYFTADTAQQLSASIDGWLNGYKMQRYPDSKGMPFLTWRGSCEKYLDFMLQ
ncbi:glycosyltransferase [Marinobacter salinexigens]|uniref:Glycosyltransferase n=1 Tax=Marinobacter salinexigens TaxID=2919747 RepID=A0A5B0VJ57_9GAMM|nr:glycosyltransferase [Marinobacter salinexigens]KAA1174682.1 glycosyltransferase [Marinobacter salinexigens]